MPDVGDSKVYLAGVVSILAEYPIEVMEQLADPRSGTRVLGDFPTLSTVRKACDALFEPIERRRARANHTLELPRPKRTPEQQARIDAQVARATREIAEAALSTTDPPIPPS